jgi:hypothetical protein
VQDVLHGMHHDRAMAALDGGQALHAQQVRPTELRQERERRGQAAPGHRVIEDVGKGGEVCDMRPRISVQPAGVRQGAVRQ